MQMSFPELVGDMPSYTTFYRRAQADIPEPLKVLGREGEKAFRDRCAPYIRRVYDDSPPAAVRIGKRRGNPQRVPLQMPLL